MFRAMRRARQQVSQEECRRILREEKRAAFSVMGDDGYPYTVPVDFYYDEEDNCIYLHGAKSGHKIDAIRRCDKVCLTTWNQGYRTEGSWEWNATSVVVFGRARLPEDRAAWEDKLRRLAIKYYPTVGEAEAEMNTPPIHAVQMIAIDIEHMTGKLVNER
ncbi:MAG: pyridoxamine 5'-phosphate oxidase family protein [Aristaeellaceae bacterium]